MHIIYDLGANNGDNLPYYLFRADKVVAVEANPELCEQIRKKFPSQIQDKSLVLYNCAITNDDDGGETSFFLHDESHVLSQLREPPESELHAFRRIRIPSITMAKLIAEQGKPHYIKIDLEHYDGEILKSMHQLGVFPDYLSAEAQSDEVFRLLLEMGYKRFKLVDGGSVCSQYREVVMEADGKTLVYSFPHHSAGPYGNDVDGPWIGKDEFSRILAREGFGWKDIHASRRSEDSDLQKPTTRAGVALVSVVVPVYNVSKYIRDCVESLLSQTLREIEIIFVDDASPDDSVAIIEEAVAGDDRVIILRNERNMGVGASRNRGMSVATAEYVKVIDSDDYLSHGALKQLHDAAVEHQVDIVFHGAAYLDEQGACTYSDYIENHKSLERMHGHAAWWYLFRRQLLVDHPEIRFPVGPHPHEDTTFSFMLLSHCESTAYVPTPCVYYRQHDQMVTKRLEKQKEGGYADSAAQCLKLLCEFYSGLERRRAKVRRDAFLSLAGYFSKYCDEDRQPELYRRIQRRLKYVDAIKRFLYRSKTTKTDRVMIRLLGIPVWFAKRGRPLPK